MENIDTPRRSFRHWELDEDPAVCTLAPTPYPKLTLSNPGNLFICTDGSKSENGAAYAAALADQTVCVKKIYRRPLP